MNAKMKRIILTIVVVGLGLGIVITPETTINTKDATRKMEILKMRKELIVASEKTTNDQKSNEQGENGMTSRVANRPPVVTLKQIGGEILNTEPYIPVTATDPDGDGVRTFKYAWDYYLDPDRMITEASYNELKPTRTIPISLPNGNGLHILRICAVDEHGNQSDWQMTPYYIVNKYSTVKDTTPPEFDRTHPEELPFSKAEVELGKEITIRVSDPESGIYYVAYSWAREGEQPQASDYTIVRQPKDGIVKTYAPNETGRWNLRMYATNSTYNASTQEYLSTNLYRHEYTIVDKIAPKVTLIGNSEIIVPLNGKFQDPGAKVTDNYDQERIIYAIDASNVDVTKRGVYTVTYRTTDAAGNTSNTVTRTVIVEAEKDLYELTAPTKNSYKFGEEIDITGAQIKLTSKRGEVSYINVSKDMFKNFSTQLPLGNRKATFTYADASITYNYEVVDYITGVKATNPTKSTYEYNEELDLNGATVTKIMASGLPQTPESITSNMLINNFDKTLLGEQTIRVNYAGFETSFKVTVQDKTAPTINVNSESTVTILMGEEFTNPSATASDNYDGDLTDAIVVTGSVNNMVAGSYQIKYNVTDSNGNKAQEVIITVIVEQRAAPTIQLSNENVYEMTIKGEKPQFVATATDSEGTPINVSITDNIQTDKIGSYTVTFEATDRFGRKTVIEKTFEVKGKVLTINEITLENNEPIYDGNKKEVSVVLPQGVGKYTLAYYNEKQEKEENPTNAGTYKVTIVAEQGEEYSAITEEMEIGTLTIRKAPGTEAPAYKLPTGLKAIYGDKLSNITLPTGFEFENITEQTTVGNAGENEFSVKYTPADLNNYEVATGIKVTILVAKKDLTVAYPTSSEITYGQKLADSTLTGGDTTYGSFSWENVNEIPTVENNGYTVVFTPNEETQKNYDVKNGTATVSIKVNKAIYELPETVSFEDVTVTYDGQKHEVVVTNLPVGIKATYTDNEKINAGTYNAKVTFAIDTDTQEGIEISKNYSGVRVNGTQSNELTAILQINRKTITEADMNVVVPAQLEYNGEAKELTVTPKQNIGATIGEIVYTGNNLVEGKPVNVGTYTAKVTVEGTENYTGTCEITRAYTITAKPIIDTDIETSIPEDLIYNGEAKEVIVTLNNGIDADVVITYEGAVNEAGKAVNAGEYTANIAVTGKGNFAGTVNKTENFTITPKTITLADITVEEPENLTCNGETKEVKVTLNNGIDANVVVTYTGNVNENGQAVDVGTYTANVTVTGKGNYAGTVNTTKEFTIASKAILDTDVTVNVPENLVYDGEAKEVTVTLNNGVQADVVITYEGVINEDGKAVNVGEYTANIVVTGKGIYAGTVNKIQNFTITPKTIVDTDVTVKLPENLEYNGIEKEVTVTLNNGVQADVVITYEGAVTEGKAVNVGTYTANIAVTGKGNFTGTINKTENFEITTKQIKDTDIAISVPEDLIYNGESKEVTVTLNNGIDADIVITYEGAVTEGKAVNAGEYTANITVTGKGNFAGIINKTKTFTIVGKQITDTDVTVVVPEDLSYNGQAKEVTVALNNGIDADIVITYTGAVNAEGKAVEAGDYIANITVTGKGNYFGTINKTENFTISGIKITDEDVTVNMPEDLIYNGEAKEVTVTLNNGIKADVKITYSGVNLVEGKAVNIGEYKANIEITGKENYTGTINKTESFTILEKEITDADVTIVAPENLVYNGETKEITVTLNNGITADVIVTYSGDNLVDGKPVEIGEYTANVIIAGIENYSGTITKTVTFTISADVKEITDADVTIALPENLEYDGTAKEVTVTLNNGITADIEITYEGNNLVEGKPVNGGEYTANIVVRGYGDYTGTIRKTVTFTILGIQIKDTDVVIANPEDLVYNGEAKEVTVTLNNGIEADVEVTYVGEDLVEGKAVNAGEYTANIVVTGKGSSSGTVTKTTTFTISKAIYDMSGVKYTGTEVTYDGKKHSVYVDINTLPQGVIVISYAGNGRVFAGSYEITVGFAGDIKNYELIPQQKVILKVNKNKYDMSKVTFSGTEVPYDGQPHSITVNEATLPAGVRVKSYEGNGQIDAGEHTITVIFTANDTYNYEAIEPQEVTLKITKKQYDMSKVTFSGTEATYDGQPHSITVNEATLPAGVSVKAYEGNGKIDAGTYTVVVSFTSDDPTNYDVPEDMSVTLEVKPKTIEETDINVVLPENLEYDGTVKELTVQPKENITANITEIKYSGANLVDGKPVNIGTYTATIKVEGTGNYTGSLTITKEFSILRKEITQADVTVELPENLVYDGTAKEIKYQIADGKTADVQVTYIGDNFLVEGKPVNVGTYTANILVSGTGEYAGRFTITKEYTILEKEITQTDITVNMPANLTYDGTAKEVTVTLNNGIEADVAITYEGTVNEEGKAVNAGEYTAKVVVTGKGNYAGTVNKEITFTIAGKAITDTDVTVNEPANLTYDGTAKEATVL